jgi:hypothetical protein
MQINTGARILMAISILFVCSSAHAVTKLEKLLALYKDSQPLEAEVQGFWAGRCVLVSNPNSYYAQLFAGVVSSDPAFYIGHLSDGAVQPEDRFDNLTGQQLLGFQNYVNGQEFRTYNKAARTSDGTFQVNNNQTGINISFLVRKNQDFIVSQARVLKSSGNWHAGDLFAVCSFFKRL